MRKKSIPKTEMLLPKFKYRDRVKFRKGTQSSAFYGEDIFYVESFDSFAEDGFMYEIKQIGTVHSVYVSESELVLHHRAEN